MYMKKIGILITTLLLSITTTVQAKECQKISESSAVNVLYSDRSSVDVTIGGTKYPAGTPFSQIPYCNLSNKEKMDNGACWSFAVSNILRSFGSDVYSEQFAEYFCNNSTFNAALTGSNDYTNITLNSEVHEHFHMKIEKIGNSMEALDQTLEEGKGVLASINGTRVFAESGAGHYIAILMKKDNQYYVANSSVTVKRGWVERSVVESEIINKISQGLYAVYPSECVSFSSQSSSSSSPSSSTPSNNGLKEDEYEGNGFRELEVKDIDCTNIFMESEGTLNELGEFVQGLFTLIKLAAPALVIILSTVDYVKAITNSDDSEMKKATQRTIKRIIFGFLIFLLPFLLDLLFHLFGLYDLSTCGIGSDETILPTEGE